ncbi:LOW QUALITY PROTEIN: SAP domain-containing ribonucleoprotein-like [Erinaceus europaeus]|uniref:LOW QUALITY PROTEIN: SAP domain-containing ribonucleoprotein-like n=1 Tax=Erinaceus europaeus TaxID=9365 RepID=A0ABM3YD58_ERIEU|nr:LOW QUALITY PROTEIN: SAP domain-containing ribonucleoprotein-like [Erinaceus europaeus]
MAQQVFLKDLRAEFSCHVCLDLLTDPVTLDCGHHCCVSCLQKRWQDRLDILPCPVCQHHCAHRKLQKNSQLSTLVDMVKQLPSSGSKRKQQQQQEQPLCEQHQQVLSLFCEQELQLVCVQCRVSCEQQGHPVTPTEEAAFHHRKKLKSHLQTLSKQLEDAHKGLEMQNRSSVEWRGSKMAAATVECHKLKLEELKQECLARGLETKGKKQDVSNRLLAYLEEHGEEEANEEDVLGDETEDEEPKPLDLPVQEEEKSSEKTVDMTAEKKVIKLTSEMSQAERMQKRAERFNVPLSLESKKAAWGARFGISSVSKKGLSHDTKPMVNLDKLRQRAQRFGLNVSSSIYRMSEGDEKLQKRKERFGIVPNSAGTGTTEDTEAKKRKRAERFGMAW